MQKAFVLVQGERGSVLVVTIMVLAILSIVAFAAARSGTTEVQIAGNELQHQKYFFTAEAGIDHAVKLLEERFREVNDPAARVGTGISWNFAFAGADQQAGTADDAFEINGDHLGSYLEGAVWIRKTTLDGMSYRVTLWNNDDSALGGVFDDDRDGRVWIRSDARGPKGGGASIQVLLQGVCSGQAYRDYTAQAGGSAGMHYPGADLNPIVDFNRQL